MQISRSLFIFLTFVLASCADLSQRGSLAPVVGGYPDRADTDVGIRNNSVPKQPPEIVETKPLDINKPQVLTEIKPELPPPVADPMHSDLPQDSPLDPAGEATGPFGTEPPSAETTGQSQPDPVPEPTESISPSPPVQETPKEPDALQPLETFAPQSPAVGSLVMAANENSEGGNLDSAVASIERAIRIEPRNAALYYKLAVLRLKQSKPRLAEDIGRKAALLAVSDTNLKKHSWLLVAKARTLQGNVEGANKAKAEAAKY